MQLFLDCDGVLADFDGRATKVLGMPPSIYEEKYGTKSFWDKIYADKNFFGLLTPMEDAYELFDAVVHLTPVILTGKPRGEWAVEQKLAFRDKYFPGVEMVVCPARNKIKFAKPGDVIVDDREKYRQTWIDGGGVCVSHTSAKDSIRQLKELGVI